MQLPVNYVEHDFANLPVRTMEVELDPAQTGLILIDMQHDFCSPGGQLHRKGMDLTGVQQTIEPIARLAAACRQRGVQVIYTKHSFRPDLCDMGLGWADVYKHRPGSRPPGEPSGPAGAQTAVMVKGKWNTEIIPALTPQPGDIVIENKHKHSAFIGTDLAMILRNLGLVNLLFAGATTAVCVGTSLIDACHRDFRCFLLQDCTAEKGEGLKAAFEQLVMIHFGYLTDSQAVMTALGAAGKRENAVAE